MTPVDTLGEPVTVVDALGEPVVLINNDGTPAFLAYSAKTYLGGVAPYHWLDFIANRALYAGADVGNVTQATGYSFSRASDGYYTNSDGTLTLFGSGALRRGDRGVLIEGARTNLLLRSQEFDNAAWTKGGSSVTANATAAPDGTTTADKLVEDSANAGHLLFQTVDRQSNNSVTMFMKAGERTHGFLQIGDAATPRNRYTVVVDLATGLVTDTRNTNSPTGTSNSVTALANGWYRVTITLTNSATAVANVVVVAGSSNSGTPAYTADGQPTYTGDNTSGIYLWGAQLEAASFPSSYIPTTTASATRAADSLVYTAGVSYPLSMFIEAEPQQTVSGAYFLDLTDGAGNNQAVFYDNNPNLHHFVKSGGGAVVDQSQAYTIGSSVFKAAARNALNDMRGAVNGTLKTADTVAALPAAITTIGIGYRVAANAQQMFGHIRRAAIFNSVLSDVQLQTVTT
jgi:hypothetical protein